MSSRKKKSLVARRPVAVNDASDSDSHVKRGEPLASDSDSGRYDLSDKRASVGDRWKSGESYTKQDYREGLKQRPAKQKQQELKGDTDSDPEAIPKSKFSSDMDSGRGTWQTKETFTRLHEGNVSHLHTDRYSQKPKWDPDKNLAVSRDRDRSMSVEQIHNTSRNRHRHTSPERIRETSPDTLRERSHNLSHDGDVDTSLDRSRNSSRERERDFSHRVKRHRDTNRDSSPAYGDSVFSSEQVLGDAADLDAADLDAADLDAAESLRSTLRRPLRVTEASVKQDTRSMGAIAEEEEPQSPSGGTSWSSRGALAPAGDSREEAETSKEKGYLSWKQEDKVNKSRSSGLEQERSSKTSRWGKDDPFEENDFQARRGSTDHDVTDSRRRREASWRQSRKDESVSSARVSSKYDSEIDRAANGDQSDAAKRLRPIDALSKKSSSNRFDTESDEDEDAGKVQAQAKLGYSSKKQRRSREELPLNARDARRLDRKYDARSRSKSSSRSSTSEEVTSRSKSLPPVRAIGADRRYPADPASDEDSSRVQAEYMRLASDVTELRESVDKEDFASSRRSKAYEGLSLNLNNNGFHNEEQGVVSDAESIVADMKKFSKMETLKVKRPDQSCRHSETSSLQAADDGNELERHFPQRCCHVHVVSWNMASRYAVRTSEQGHKEQLNAMLFPATANTAYDVYVIGTQESPKETRMRELDCYAQQLLGDKYVPLYCASFHALHTSVFVRRELLWYCSVVESDTLSTRLGSPWATKGCQAVAFYLFGTSFLFMNSHFTAGDFKLEDRYNDYKTTISKLQLAKKDVMTSSSETGKDVTARFDRVFWLGDFNFRVELTRDRLELRLPSLESTKLPLWQQADLVHELLQWDELTRMRHENQLFENFQEGRIKFAPTYKFNMGEQTYDTNPKTLRVPSYTDRVMFRSRKKNGTMCLHYDSITSITVSDHKPVYGCYQVSLEALEHRISSIPSNNGKFDYDIYNKGLTMRGESGQHADVSGAKTCRLL